MIPWQDAPWTPRTWQAAALPVIIAAIKQGDRGLVAAVMGSGKSVLMSEIAAMAMEKLRDRAIIFVVPSVKLVLQLCKTLRVRLDSKDVGVFYGKQKQPNRKVIVCCRSSLAKLHLKLLETDRKCALMIVDEAHGSEAETLKQVIPDIDPICLVGFTATPFRSAPKQTVSLFTKVLFRYTMKDALRDGVLVDFKYRRYEGTVEPDSLDQTCFDMVFGDTEREGPVIFSAVSIKDAEDYAEFISERGKKALAIHSKISEKEQEARIEQLKSGEVDALVHVSLLAEGVDFPWLGGLCFRRKVQAGIRWLQEFGRPLRSDPGSGKKFAYIYDPHCLLGKHGLVSTEAIGQALEDAADIEANEEKKEGAAKEIREHQVVALDILLEYLAEVRSQMRGIGILKGEEINSTAWRITDVSEKQVDAIKKSGKNTRHIPKEYRDPIRALVKIPWILTRGQAADLLDILIGGRKYCYGIAKQTGQPIYRVHWSADLGVVVPNEEQIKLVKSIK